MHCIALHGIALQWQRLVLISQEVAVVSLECPGRRTLLLVSYWSAKPYWSVTGQLNSIGQFHSGLFRQNIKGLTTNQ